MDYINLMIPKMGMVRALPTDAKHIYVSTPEHGVITVNGVDYYLSAHIYLWEDGAWHWGASRDTQYSEPHMRRIEPTGNPGNRDYNPSYAAREKVRVAVLVEVLNSIVANKAVMNAAHVEDLKTRLKKALAEKEELVTKVAEKLDEMSDLDEEIAKAENYQLVPAAKAS